MKYFLASFVLFSAVVSQAQKPSGIDPKEVERIERTLASDDMRGRRTGTPDIDRAANFIAEEFAKAGLKPLQGTSFLQSFVMVKPKLKDLKAKFEGSDIDVKQVMVITTQADLTINEKSGYATDAINKGDNIFMKAMEFQGGNRNLVVLVDTSFSKQFPRLAFLKRQLFQSNNSLVFILGSSLPKEYTIKAEHSFEEMRFSNVAGVLPGKSRKNEYVVFSAHYDHLGVGKPVNGDSIYNGANDDAAGTTAVIALASHFKKQNNNERSIIFAAFTAEEIGGYGSQYFSRQLDPAQVMAMFNIEMIGTESKWGKNSAYITGYDKTNMGEILQKNLKGSAFTFHPDPYPEQDLFYRSDNATLARLGVPAHTISTSKMDSEPNYHKASDEIGTLDLVNMTEIIRAIAVSSRSIVAGTDTPARVKAESLK
jgi:Zn-dependent M28 family amino/carboxypeptidase